LELEAFEKSLAAGNIGPRELAMLPQEIVC
jgi:hypothetical protein